MQPLTYMEIQAMKKSEEERRASGSKAFGFVLISLGVFLLATIFSIGYFFAGPLSLSFWSPA